ncbi:conserved exported hypothetical protein [Nitrospira lenta]|uniref:Lipoprotein n=2 Tax=Nitrospira lenta TaxID=1436998 RepID=A0A330L281_9BACT|nr:conserved exported hypothetical protein [Nitrospira lenta]
MLRIGLVCLAGTALAVVGCSGSKVTTKAANELPRYQVKTMAFVPFTTIATPQVRDQGDLIMSTPQSVRRSDISIEVPSNVEHVPRQTVRVPAVAAEKVAQLFWTRLRHRTGVTVLSPSDTRKAMASLGGDPLKTTPELAAAAVARKLTQDAALIGEVLVYQERVGSRMGASPAAAVGFEVKVIAADGQVLWVGNYYERQRPMIEDFMGFIHRWAFVTADELAVYGVDEVLKEFPFGAGGEK